MDSNLEIEFAEQQLTGFFHARHGYTLLQLVQSMGLTSEEWAAIKASGRIHVPLDARAELDQHFGQGQ